MSSTTGVEVRAVRTRADRTAFLELPYRLNRDEARWVPPLRGDQRRMLDRRANPFFDYGDAELFLACEHGQAVGRIAAVDNPRHNSFHGEGDGFFGLFTCIADDEVARCLLEAASGWLAGRGHHRILGPTNLTTNDECGLLIDGFDQWPAVQMPYNPPHYARLLANCGLEKATDLLAWEVGTRVHENARLAKLEEFAERRANYRVRPIDLGDFAAESERIRHLYNEAWGDNWGFSPITQREFTEKSRQLRRLTRPELALIAESGDEPVGFALALPDLSPALAAANGRLHSCGVPLGLYRLLRARKHVDRVRLIALGLRPDHRRNGLDVLMLMRLSRAALRLGYATAEVSWVLEDNEPANNRLRRLGARTTKRYRLYQRSL